MGGKNPGKGNCGIAFIEYIDSELMCRCLSDAVSNLNVANAHLELTLVAEEEQRHRIAIRNLMMDAISAVDASQRHARAFRDFLVVNLDEIRKLSPGTIPAETFDYAAFRQNVVEEDDILDAASYDQVSAQLASGGFTGFFIEHIQTWDAVLKALARLRNTFDGALAAIATKGGIGLASHDNRIPIRQDYTRAYSKMHRAALDWTVFALVSTELHLHLCGLPTIARKLAVVG